MTEPGLGPPFVRKVIDRIHRLSGLAAVCAAAVAMLITLAITADVLFRATTGGSVRGLLEMVETLMVLIVYLGLAEAEKTKTHLRLELVTDSLPARLRYAVRSVAMTVATAGTGLFIYATAMRAIDSVELREFRPGLLNFPVWPARLVIVFGFCLLLLETLTRLYENLMLIRHPDSAEEEPAPVPHSGVA